MRARFLALFATLLAAAACHSAAPASPGPSSPPIQSPRERFTDVRKRWEDAYNLACAETRDERNKAIMGEKADRTRPARDPTVLPAEFMVLYAECEGLAPEVPEALQFCIAISCRPPPGAGMFPGVLGPETLYKTVRAAPASESVDRLLWKLWTGCEPDGDRYSYLHALSNMPELPPDSLARGWARLAKAVWVHGIGAPDALSHESKLALDALDGIEEDYPGTAVARHAHALRRSVLAFDTAAPAPALELVDVQGQAVSLSKKRNRCALVLFWDPADPSSEHMLARIEQMDVRADLLGVQVGGDAADVARLLQGNRNPCRAAIVPGSTDSVLRDWGVLALPASFLVDKDGRVRAIDQFGEGLNRTVKTLLEQTYVGADAR